MDKTGFVRSTRDGTRLWWGSVGSGPPVILCDGFACDGFIWPYVIDDFHEHLRLVRWHYRGHGNSEKPRRKGIVHVEDFCHDLADVLDHLGIESAVLAGHSMGVQVILQFFDLYPQRVKALIPICGTYKRPLDTFHNHDRLAQLLPYLDKVVDFAPERLQTLWQTLTPSPVTFHIAARTSEINSKFVRKQDFQPYLEHVANMDLRVFMRMLKGLSEHSAEAILPHINVPTFIIAGEFDSFTPTSRSYEMNEAIAHSELLVVPGGTHVAPVELPDLINSAVEKFLQKNDLWG
ncbi:MAG: alpha/beta hydrolase [bacterium]